MSRWKERLPLLVTFGAVCAMALILAWPIRYPLTTRIAAVGGMIAALGGVAALRPLLRVGGLFGGPLILIQASVFRERSDFLPDETNELLSAYKDEYEQMADYAETAVGIFLVALGTLINGFSGFFDGFEKLLK